MYSTYSTIHSLFIGEYSMPNTFPTAYEVDEKVKSVCRVEDLPEYKASSRFHMEQVGRKSEVWKNWRTYSREQSDQSDQSD